MNKYLVSSIILICAAFLSFNCVFAQDTLEYDMGKMQMVFLAPVQEWKPKSADDVKRLNAEQRKFVDALIVSGKCALAGPATGAGQIREVLIFKIESPEEVETITASLPAVKAGMMKAEALAWYAARNYIMTPESPLKPASYVLGLLVRGPKWTPEKTAETEKIQEGHMANINRLAELGKLSLAGPFFDDGERRGVFIFKVDSLAEAQALTDTDPAVKTGRLTIELYNWTVPNGILK